MHKTRTLWLLALAALAVVTPVMAGSVYVAPASDFLLNGIEFVTELKVTNPSQKNQTFTAYFIPAFTNGAKRPKELELPEQIVAPGKTVVYRGNLVPAGQTGMLEITADNLIVTARLVPRRAGKDGTGAPLPVVSSSTHRVSNMKHYLQGGRRSASEFTAFGMVNPTQNVGECTVDIKNSGGAKLIGTATLAVPPVSVLHWTDVFEAVGVDAVTEARFEVLCTRFSYPYAIEMNTASAAASALIPRDSAANSTYGPPGEAAVCPANATCFDAPGLFHTPTFGKTTYVRSFAVPPGTQFRRIKLSLKFRHGGWFAALPDGIHNIFWLFNDNWANTLGYVNARGPNRNIVTSGTFAGFSAIQRPKKDARLVPGTTYQVNWDYDAKGRRITTTITTLGGTVVAEIVQGAGRGSFTSDGDWDLWVGNPDERSHGYLEIPSIGWNYSDLHVEFIP